MKKKTHNIRNTQAPKTLVKSEVSSVATTRDNGHRL